MTRARALACLLALAATSCGAPLLKLPAGPGVPATDAAGLLDAATSTCRRVSTLTAEILVSGSVHDSRVRGRLLAGLAAPASLYMEAPAPFGAPLFVLGARGDDATLVLPRDKRVLSHGRPDDVIEAIAGVPLGPSDLRDTLTGCPTGAAPDVGEARALGANWRVVGTAPALYLRREGRDPWRLVSVVHPGADGWRVDYTNFLSDLPRHIHLVSTTRGRFDLRMELSQVEMNVTLEPSTFDVKVPADMRPMTIDELRSGEPLSR